MAVRKVKRKAVREKSRGLALDLSELRLQSVLRAINEGVYDWDVAAGKIYYSEGVYSVLRLPRNMRTPADWRRRIHKDDLREYDRKLTEHFKGRRERFECDYRFRATDGAWRWARQHGTAVRDTRGNVIRLIGSIGDITEFKRVEGELKASQDRYALATQASTEGIYEWNLGTGSLYLSERAKEFFAVTGRKLTPAMWNKRVHKEDFPGYRSALAAYFRNHAAKYFEHEYRIRDASGGYAWIVDRAVAERAEKGRVLRLIGALNNVTERKLHEIELARARDEATAALERQTATAGILRVIGSSMTDSKPVFEAIVKSCGELFKDSAVSLRLARDGQLEVQAHIGETSKSVPIDRKSTVGACALQSRLIHIPDLALAVKQFPSIRKAGLRQGFRCGVYAPLLRDGKAIGTISVRRREPRAFSDKDVDLLQTFADQAVIAIENVRLFNETKEALERQTATAEILKVIAGSPSDVQPVFDAIAETARRLLGGYSTSVTRIVDDMVHLAAFTGVDESGVSALKGLFPAPLADRHEIALVAETKEPFFIADSEARLDVTAEWREMARRRGFRSVLFVPMLREGVAIGTINVTRRDPGVFSEHQINLLKTFADQAVIAIENVRLFNETKEALARQTATAEILGVIGASMTDTKPVFEAIVKSCHALFGVGGVTLRLVRDGHLVIEASVGESSMTVPVDRESAVGYCVLEGKPVHLPDLEAAVPQFPRIRQLGLKTGYRSGIYVPLLRGGAAIGTIAVLRRQAGAFDEKQVALLKTFADQAVIAIENVRLFNETKESLERQTATADVLAAISASMTDAKPVFDAIVKNVSRLFGTRFSVLQLLLGDQVEMPAVDGAPGFERLRQRYPRPLDESTVGNLAMRTKKPMHFASILSNPQVPAGTVEFARDFGFQSVVFTPLMHEGRVIGALGAGHPDPNGFNDRHVSLLKTFADQAVIAIENVRLFNETKEALERQTATAAVLRVMSDSPGDVVPVLATVCERAASICDAQVVDIVLVDGEFMRVAATFGSLGRPLGEAVPLDRSTVMGRSIVERQVVQVDDLFAAGDEYPRGRDYALKFGHRTILGVPLLREGRALGTILLRRPEVLPFNDKQIALIRTFADQAAIGIENARLFNETKEALERQTATAEILRVIASSPSDVTPVFDAIVASALHLMRGATAHVTRLEGGQLHLVSYSKTDERGAEALNQVYPMNLKSYPRLAESLADRTPQMVTDVETDPTLTDKARAAMHARGVRSNVIMPMVAKGASIGTLVVNRTYAGGFTPHEIALLKTFADQAVIAIENVRLFNETKEALETQTATAEILEVISSSPTDVRPVFDAILESATRLCDGHFGILGLYEGENYKYVAHRGSNVAFAKWVVEKGQYKPQPGGGIARMTKERGPIHIADVREAPAYRGGNPVTVALADIGGVRTYLSVPMLKDGRVIGGITIYRPEIRPFTDKQIALVSTFANQAVIAIENVRLFNETKEALERQTATAEILKVIASSPSDVQPVFDAIVATAKRLIGAFSATVTHVGEGKLHLVAHTATTPEGAQALSKYFPIPVEGTPMGRAVKTRQPNFIDDFEADTADALSGRELARLRGFRSVAFVPLLRGKASIGSLNVTRREAGRMSDHHVDLLKTFADQAVIAIENVRLFNETKESLERQTATAEILRVIASSPTDVKPVFEAILRSAVALCGAEIAAVFPYDGKLVHLGATHNWSPEAKAYFSGVYPAPPSQELMSGRTILSRDIVRISDAAADPHYDPTSVSTGHWRRMLGVPMLREGKPLGALVVCWREPGETPQRQVDLLQTFADQGVIAIDNVRLFNETKEGLERQTATAEILKVIASSPSDVQPVFDVIAESALRLFGGQSADVTRVAGEMLHLAAHTATSEEGKGAIRKSFPRALSSSSLNIAVVRTGKPAQWSDIETDPAAPEALKERARARGIRSNLIVPMLRDGQSIGTISVSRAEPGTFTGQQVDLLQTFADQGVIAIENVRLFNETTEALERQTATAEILKVIASSPSDVQPVFDAIGRSAMKLVNGFSAAVARVVDGTIHLASITSTNPEGDEVLKRLFPRPVTSPGGFGRIFETARPDIVADVETDPDISPDTLEMARARGWRGRILVPMMRGKNVIGAISITRREPGSFSHHHVELLKTFADQAVIAIENVRLFNELQSRTEALTKSVGQLTALGEVGQAISSTLDLETVLQTIVARAVQLTGVDAGAIYEYSEQEEAYRLQAAQNMAPELVDAVRAAPIKKGDGATGRTAETLEPTQVPDIQDDSYHGSRKENLMRTGYRAVLAVPLLREDHLLGALQVFRKTPGAFAPEVVELLNTFATQSAMAIQNARLFREIEVKGSQLEVASRHKSDFLANMSHELRTPLNAIIGFSEVLKERMFGELNEKQADYMNDIHESGRHLLSLINDILDLSKIEAGRMELELSHFDIRAALGNAMTLVRERAERHGIALGLEVEPALGELRADERKFKQILLNLLSNAVKFTPDGGRVDVAARLDGTSVEVSVKDTGVGIAPEDQAAVFEEFRQVGSDYTRKAEGTGLGLALTRRFVELHGGQIRLESQPGAGSTFTFTIPVQP